MSTKEKIQEQLKLQMKMKIDLYKQKVKGKQDTITSIIMMNLSE